MPHGLPPADPIHTLGRAALAEMHALAKDQFANVPTHDDQIGKPFRIVLKPNSDIGFFALYKDGALVLTYYVDMRAHINDPYYAYQIDHTFVRKGSYPASNAFGAVADVDEFASGTLAVAVASPPDGAGGSLEDSITLPGPEAKALSLSARLVIEGSVAKMLNGKVASCESRYTAPTFPAPMSGETVECEVGAEISRLAYVDGTGKVLKEWVKPEAP